MADEELNIADTLIDVLTTEEGQNVADFLAEISSHMDVVAQQLTIQNKILLKILAALSSAPVLPKADGDN